MNQQNIDYVLRSVEQRDIRFVRLWFVDILGRLKNFAISPEDLEVAFEEGIGFDGSAIEGFATPEEADMLAFPDASTFQILPWRPSHNGVARVFCDVCTPDRKPFAGDPRDALRRMFRKAEKAGYLLNVGAELEYYYFPDEHTPEPLDNVGYFDLSVSDAARDLRRNTVLTLEKMSVPVEYTFHAAGRSQHGMSLRHAEALSMSDAITTAKLIIKQQAYESGCHASFMPKPLAGEDGSAMFLHQSLFDHDGNNVFWGEDDEFFGAELTTSILDKTQTVQITPKKAFESEKTFTINWAYPNGKGNAGTTTVHVKGIAKKPIEASQLAIDAQYYRFQDDKDKWAREIAF